MIEMINLILILLLLLKYILETLYCLNLYQSDNYHYRSYKILFKEKIRKKSYDYLLIIFILFIAKIIINVILLIFLCVINIIMFINIKKIKIKKTKRIKRLCALHLILLLTIFIFENKIKLLLLINIFYLLINVILSFVSTFLESIIMQKYYKEAKRRLIKYNPFIIAITGSCGKTSVKNYIYDCLKENYLVYKTPKSYNTLKGITITINNNLKHYNEILILEMGLSHKNDINKITKLVKPNISIITEILPSHLETMKTIENIIKEKMYIIKNMKKEGLIIINNDNRYISENIEKYNELNNKIIKVGSNNTDDIYYQNLIIKKDGIKFEINNKIENNIQYIDSNLIGRHNVYNLMITYCVLNVFNESISKLKQLNNYENRLEIKRINKLIVLNDSYNSNINGFLNALEVLSLYNKPKYIITPGIVESGGESKKINSIVAKKITEVCDFCFIIDNQNTKYFIKIFIEKNYKKYAIKKDFLSAYNNVKNEEIILLIENDLTDFYYKK